MCDASSKWFVLPWQELAGLSLFVPVGTSDLESTPAFSQFVNNIDCRRKGSNEQQVLAVGKWEWTSLKHHMCREIRTVHLHLHTEIENHYPSGQRLGLKDFLQKRNVDDGQLTKDRASNSVEEKGIAEQPYLPKRLFG